MFVTLLLFSRRIDIPCWLLVWAFISEKKNFFCSLLSFKLLQKTCTKTVNRFCFGEIQSEKCKKVWGFHFVLIAFHCLIYVCPENTQLKGEVDERNKKTGNIKSVEIVSHPQRVMAHNANNNDFCTRKRLMYLRKSFVLWLFLTRYRPLYRHFWLK